MLRGKISVSFSPTMSVLEKFYVLTMLQQLLLSSSDYYVSHTAGIFNAWLEIN